MRDWIRFLDEKISIITTKCNPTFCLAFEFNIDSIELENPVINLLF
tara:strand:+ start:308 stop:445 length:138 start_codon:yes stop_codon:yes gene_type:complete